MKSDVWSLGISLIELALGRFPFADSHSEDEDSDYESTLSPARPGSISLSGLPPAKLKGQKKDRRKSKGVSLQGGGMTMSILELLQHIVNEPAPKLTPEGRFPKEAESFVDSCLMKDVDVRPTPKELLVCGHLLFPACTHLFSGSSMDRASKNVRSQPRGLGKHLLVTLSRRLSSLRNVHDGDIYLFYAYSFVPIRSQFLLYKLSGREFNSNCTIETIHLEVRCTPPILEFALESALTHCLSCRRASQNLCKAVNE